MLKLQKRQWHGIQQFILFVTYTCVAYTCYHVLHIFVLIVEYKERYTFRYVILLNSPFACTEQSSPVERGNPNIFMMQKSSNRITHGFVFRSQQWRPYCYSSHSWHFRQPAIWDATSTSTIAWYMIHNWSGLVTCIAEWIHQICKSKYVK